ncbi:MAG TPA: EH signature domain-containing protein [Candidatus Krumholzibacteria bacterium]|nr:EH signature domain-containing protein [Candidatus Krumholzibacteria bacterium]
MSRALREVRRKLGERGADPPAALELKELYGRITSSWDDTRELEGLSRKDLRRIPWILFYPVSDPEKWLGRRRRFLKVYRRWLRRQQGSLPMKALIFSYLQVYPQDRRVRREAAELIRICLERSTSPLLSAWQGRERQFRVFAGDGTTRIAKAWLDYEGEPAAFRDEVGLTGVAAVGAFSREVLRTLLAEIRGRLEQESASSDWLESKLALLLDAGGGLLFVDLRAPIAESLLEPFAVRTPDPTLKTLIRTFILRHVGDPRVGRVSSGDLPPTPRRVLMRWLVDVTLEEFFKLLDRTAKDEHWKARKKFWRAYLDSGAISDAWLVLGREARRLAQRSDLENSGVWGDLGRGGDPSQSVLLMSLGGVTVAEWSHNGRVCFWLSDNAKAPRLYELKYRRRALQKSNGADESYVHSGSWQRRVSAWVRRQTGVRHGRV